MKPILYTLVIFLAAGVAAAQEPIGEITYLDGAPEIIRDGDVLYDTLDFGFPLFNFDSIRTDEYSSVELRLDATTGVDASISVEPDTQFYLNVSSLRAEQTGSVELLSGSISVIARELTGRSRLQVRTQSSVAGVRGTTFAVTTAVGGEVLISTQEGLVEVTDNEGFALYAAPGEAVEVDTERGIIRNLKYGNAGLAEFRQQWIQERAEAFRLNAPRILRFYGRHYMDARGQFIEVYRELMSHREIIDRWIEESRRGTTGDMESVIQDTRVLAPVLIRMRASMFAFEHTFTRMIRMAAHVRDIAATVDIDPGQSAADLYRTIENDRAVMSQRLATLRHLYRLFAERTDGVGPMELPDNSSA